MFNQIRFMLWLLLALFSFQLESAPKNPSYTVVDYTGSRVSLAQPAKRILALSPHAVENIYSAGAGDRLVGVVAFSNYPEQASRITQIGSNNKLNLEAIVGLKPDLIIAWQSGNVQSHLDQLKDLGFTIYIDEPGELSDIARSIKDIGILSGTSEIADAAANKFLQRLDLLRAKYSDQPDVSVFYQIWDQPLQTLNGRHLVSAALDLCGGVNIFANEAALAPVVNIESVLVNDPQVILASGVADNRPLWLDQWHQWPNLRAVQNNHLFFVHPDHVQRHTTRILNGATTICEQLEQVRSAPLE